jgi:hypothetical protein
MQSAAAAQRIIENGKGGSENMTTEEKQRLLGLLTDSYAKVLASVEGVDPEMQVNPETDWRVRDIVGHLATWDRESSKSIRAFLEGDEYFIPDFAEDGFNDHEVQEQRKLSAQGVFALWEGARQEFIAAVRDMTLDQFNNDFLYPWGGERGNISTLVEYMTGHDVEHRAEINKVLQGLNEG